MENSEHKNQHQQHNTTQQQQHEDERPKLPKIKAFQLIQKDFAMAGISPALLTQQYPFNGRILFGFLSLSFAFYCQLIFIFDDADTFAQYTQSVYVCSIAALISLALSILILKRDALYTFINAMEDIINVGKSTLDNWNRYRFRYSDFIILFVLY